MRRLRIAFVGQRGVPATVGGVERHVEELGARLAERGHDVTVYCRTNYTAIERHEYRGMRLRSLPTVGTKHLDNIVHSGVSTLSALRTRPDIVHYHAIGSGLTAPLARAMPGTKVVLTVHGLDFERSKWGWQARTVLKTAGWMSARVPDATIAVSQALQTYYAEHYRREAHYIPNGVDPGRPAWSGILEERFALRPRQYLLFVGRLVPEKAPDLLLRAFRRLADARRLVIAGDSGFTDDFVARLKAAGDGDERVLFTGAVHGEVLRELYANAAAFVLPSFLEGLPLTLLEAASFGTPVIVSDIPPHLEVVGGDGPGHRLFPRGDEARLATAIQSSDASPAELAGAMQLRDSVLRRYDWGRMVDATELVYEEVLSGRTFSSAAAASG